MNISENKSQLLTLPQFAEASSADHLIALFDENQNLLATAALWWSNVPSIPNENLACIGSFHATSEQSCHQLLTYAENFLRNQGVTQIIGPMNGNTWRKHRFVIESNNLPPFALEPTNDHPEQPEWWISQDYQILSQYSSSLVPLTGSQVTNQKIRQRLIDNDVTLASLDMTRFEEDLHEIYNLSTLSFSNNFLYTPIDWTTFFSQYQKVQSWINPRYVILARCENQTVGFVFAFPDPLAIQRKEKPALIVKTLASTPERRFAGLGNWLVDEAQLRAHQDGLSHAIHALQFQDNSSLKITARFQGHVFRRYALFCKKLPN